MKRKQITQNLKRNLKMSWELTKGTRKYLIGSTILILLLVILCSVVPVLSARQIIHINAGKFEKLFLVSLFILIFEIFINTFRYIYHNIGQLFYRNTLLNIQTKIAKEIMNLETKDLDKNTSGLFIDRLKLDSTKLADIYNELIALFMDIAGNIGILIAIFLINRVLFVYFVITIIILFILDKKKMEYSYSIDEDLRLISEKNTGLITEMIRGIRDIKVLNSESIFVNKVKKNIEKTNDKRYELLKTDRKWMLLTNNVRDILEFSFIVLGIWLITKEMLSIESFIIVFMYRDRLYGLLNYFTSMLEYTKEFNLSANRVFEIFGSDNFQREKFGTEDITEIEGSIKFDNVKFGYTEIEVLKGINFEINKNEKVAFVGKSGQGKSTILSLISKMYSRNSGRILIDNIDIDKLTKGAIRENITMVNQMPYIFNLSIKENLKIVKEDVTDEELIEVCKKASIHETIMGLEEGYDTVVGEGGITLSGGQRQRLAIARALLKTPKIILFDEATSALDNETQKEVTKAIDDLKGEYTIIIVAHRLSTIIDCDRIFLVDNGKIVSSGTHKELMETSKEYRNLYESEEV